MLKTLKLWNRKGVKLRRSGKFLEIIQLIEELEKWTNGEMELLENLVFLSFDGTW